MALKVVLRALPERPTLAVVAVADIQLATQAVLVL
jgi:hypothetical protein